MQNPREHYQRGCVNPVPVVVRPRIRANHLEVVVMKKRTTYKSMLVSFDTSVHGKGKGCYKQPQ